MKREVGLWIDHNKAVIVTIVNQVEVTRKFKADVEKDGFPSTLDGYYDGIVSLVRDAESIWIFGPDEAKIEFEDRLKREKLGARVVGINPAGAMSDLQIEAKVRARYLK